VARKAKSLRRTEHFAAFRGEKTDDARGSNVRSFKSFEGLMTASSGENGQNMAVSCDGYEMMHYAPLQVNASRGAAEGVEAGYPDTASLVMLDFPEVDGNVFAVVHNGNGDVSSEWHGREGEFMALYQETWGGRGRLAVLSRNNAPPMWPLIVFGGG